METPQDPIELMLEEHDRQLDICARLETLISSDASEWSKRRAASLLDFLCGDLPVHIKDEERDLFPMLLARQESDQNLAVILDQLVSEHELDHGLIEPIVADLRHIVAGRNPDDRTRFCVQVRTFTEDLRRHLNWENRVVLPLARRVLSAEDRLSLGISMAARRQQRSDGDG